MTRLGSCYMHPLLLLITLVLLATSALSTEQSNPAKLRPERILKSQGTFTCSANYSCNTEYVTFNGNKASYSVLLESGSRLGLQITPDDEKDLIIYFEADASAVTYAYLGAFPPQNWTLSYEQVLYFQQSKTMTTVPGPIGTVYISFVNTDSMREADITLTITYPGNGNGHNTPVWVIPVSASIGALIVAIVVVFCYYRKKRRNRQRRYDQPVQIRHQNIWQRNQNNAQPRQEANPPKQLSIQEIIDMRFPEARFEQFESYFQQKTCTICLDDMKKEQICRQLDCQHIFHTQCGKQWLENQFQKIKKAFCPNCNQQVNMLNPKKRSKAKERRV